MAASLSWLRLQHGLAGGAPAHSRDSDRRTLGVRRGLAVPPAWQGLAAASRSHLTVRAAPKALWLGSSPRGASERGHQKLRGTPTGGGATPRLSPSRTAGPRGRGGVPSGPRERAAWAWPVPSSAVAALPDLEHLPVCRSTCCSSSTPPPPSPSPPGRPPLRAPPPRRRRHSWPPERPPHTRAAQSRGAAYAVPSLSWDAAGKGRSGCTWCDRSGLTRVSRSGHGGAGGSSRERGAASGPARLSRSSGRRPAWTHGGPRCGAAPGRRGTARPGRSECRGKQGGREWGVWDGAVPRWVFADSHRRPVLPGSCCTLIPSPGFPQSCPTCTPICHHPIFGIFSFLLLRLLAP